MSQIKEYNVYLGGVHDGAGKAVEAGTALHEEAEDDDEGGERDLHGEDFVVEPLHYVSALKMFSLYLAL